MELLSHNTICIFCFNSLNSPKRKVKYKTMKKLTVLLAAIVISNISKSMDVQFEFKGFDFSTNCVITKIEYPVCLVHISDAKSEMQTYEKISIKMIKKLDSEKPEFDMYICTSNYYNIARFFPVNGTGKKLTEKILCEKILQKPNEYIHSSLQSCFDSEAYYYMEWPKRK